MHAAKHAHENTHRLQRAFGSVAIALAAFGGLGLAGSAVATITAAPAQAITEIVEPVIVEPVEPVISPNIGAEVAAEEAAETVSLQAAQQAAQSAETAAISAAANQAELAAINAAKAGAVTDAEVAALNQNRSPDMNSAIQKLEDAGVINKYQEPYVMPAALMMLAHNNNQVNQNPSNDDGQKFTDTITQLSNIAIVSSKKPQDAVKKGLDPNWAPYFNQCVAQNGGNAKAVSADQAQRVLDCAKTAYFENNTRPEIEQGAGIAALAIASLAGGAALASRSIYL